MRGWQRWAVIAGWLLIALFAVWFDVRLVTTPLSTQLGLSSVGGDFTMYYSAARALRLNPHANIYSLATLRAAYPGGCGGPPTTGYPYQPLLALLLEPLTLLPCASALYVWWQFSTLLWAVITFWLARDATKMYGPGRGLLVGVLCVIYRPIWNGLEYGQIHLLTLAVFVVASRLATRRRLLGAGSVLGVGGILKYVPGVLALYHLVRGRWRVAMATVVTAAALLLAEALAVGPTTLVGSIAGASSDVATYGALHRNWLTGIPDGAWIARLMLVTACATVVVVSWRRHPASEALGEGWILCSLLLAMPLTWYHYLTWLLPLVVTLLHTALDCTISIPHGWSVEAVVRRLPLVVFALIFGSLLVPGPRELLVGPALFGMWGLTAALYLLSAKPFTGVFASLPAAAPQIGRIEGSHTTRYIAR